MNSARAHRPHLKSSPPKGIAKGNRAHHNLSISHPHTTTPAPTMEPSPEPEAHPLIGKSFESLQLAENALRETAKEAGYALRTLKKTPNATNPNRAIYACTRGGTQTEGRAADTHESKKRKTSSQRKGCPFKIAVKASASTEWTVEAVRGEHTQHTHDMLGISAFPQYRLSLLEPYLKEVIEFSEAGNKPTQILKNLRKKNPALRAVIAQDVTNHLFRHRQDELNGKTPTQWLLDRVSGDQGYISAHKSDSEQHLTHLFIAARANIAIWLRHPDVLLLDNTYKTNRFRMPLTNIVGITNQRSFFQIAVVFLKGEKEPEYAWVLEQLHKVMLDHHIEMPRIILTDRDTAYLNALGKSAFRGVHHLLCQWHVRMNVVANCKKFYPAARKVPGQALPVRDEGFVAFLAS